MRPAFSESGAAKVADFLVGVTQPSDRSRVRGISVLQQLGFTRRLRRGLSRENLERFIARERIGDVPEIDARHELLWCHVGEQLPDRFFLRFCVQIPHRIHDRGKREVNDALLGSEPSQLRLTRQAVPELSEIGRDVAQRPPDDQMPERFDRRGTDFISASDREREAVSLESLVGFQNDVRGRVIGIGVNRVGANLIARGWEPEIEDG